MPEKFEPFENVFNENNIFEIDAEENVMRGSAFLKIIDEIREECLSCMENQIDGIFESESVELKGTKDLVSNSVTYEIKSLMAENSELVWKKKRLRFRLLIEASEDSKDCPEDAENSSFQSPLDDIRQSIQSTQTQQ